MTDTARNSLLKIQDCLSLPQYPSPVRWLPIVNFLSSLLSAVSKTATTVAKSIYRSLFPAKVKCLRGEIVLVTGAGRGLSRELALQFASHGCIIVCVDINQKDNEQTVRDINARFCLDGGPPAAYSFLCDVSDSSQVQKMAQEVLATLDRVDILVNNAGVMPVQPADLVDAVSVNLLAHFWTLLAFVPGMIARQHGHLVAISSVTGLNGLANEGPYSASKFAVTGLMDALTEELRLDSANVKLTCVHHYFLHPEDLHLRIPELSPELAALEILDAVRHDEESITVPRNLLFWTNVLRALPQDARHVWQDLFYTNVTPSAFSPQQQTTFNHKT